MIYRFELRYMGEIREAESGSFDELEEAIEYGVAFAIKNGIPNSKLWVLDESGVVLILGIRTASRLSAPRRSRRAEERFVQAR